MSAIPDIAPTVDGDSADIGYCFVGGGDPMVDAMGRRLLQVHDHILQAMSTGKRTRAIYQELDVIGEASGFVNLHRSTCAMSPTVSAAS